MLFSDGTGNSNKDFNGLGNIVGTAGNTVGGIDASTNSWWDPYVINSGATLSEDNMANVYNNASKGSDTPDLIVTTEALFAKYESLLTPQVRYQDVAKANLGFTNLMFKQTPVVFDLGATKQDGTATNGTGDPMYFINSKYLKLTGMNGHWFQTTEFQNGTVAGKDARYALVMAFGELTCSNRSRQGFLSANA